MSTSPAALPRGAVLADVLPAPRVRDAALILGGVALIRRIDRKAL